MKKNNLHTIFLICFLFSPIIIQSQNKAIDSLENELRHHKKNDTTKVNLLNALAFSYASFDINKSDEKAQAAHDLAKQLNFIKGKATSFLRFGFNQIKKSELDEAEASALKALKLCEEINDQACINSSYISLAEVAHYNNDIDKATGYYNKVLSISIKNGDLLSQADMLNNLGISSYKKGDFDEALSFFKKAHKIQEQLGQEKLSLGTLNNIAVISLNQGRYTEALEYFNKCLSIYREDNNKHGIAKITYNMSAVYYELKQYDKALSYLEESLPLYTELENRRQVAQCLVNIGAVYADLKAFPKALDYMTESLKISTEIDEQAELNAVNFQLGDLHLLMEQPNLALKHYKTCLEISVVIEEKLFICHAHIGLARAYVLLKNYSKALYHALEGEKIAEDLELLAQKKLAFETLATIYSKTGNYKKAFENHQQFKTLSDSIFNKESIEKITQIEYEYKYKQALDSASIRELKLTKTVLNTSKDLKQTQQNYLWAIIGFLLVSIVLGSVIFFQKFRNIKSKNENIVMQQKLLRSQMTPHFIFNSMAVLQGMILNKEEKKSVNYLSKFSKLLRITLENSRDKMVSLSEELEALENYLALQNLENEAYQYTILVEDTVDVPKFEIPPMLIQPFVENAVEHAFIGQKGYKKIDVHLTYNSKKLICTITDNGIGINTLKEIKNHQKKSLATAITSERLKILSEDLKMEGSVTIEDRKKHNEEGTIVTLLIPHKTAVVS